MDMEKIIGLVTKTKELIKNREMAAHVNEKGVADYVTQVDIAVQNFLKKELFQFLGEETGLQEIKADSFWILDPVDGTTNLMHDYQHSVVSLALCHQDEIVMGIVYNPFHEEIFSAINLFLHTNSSDRINICSKSISFFSSSHFSYSCLTSGYSKGLS
jgi:myo-inositol-1(or 4)-monophosphatase